MRHAIPVLSCSLIFSLALHAQEEEGKRKFPAPESLSTDSLISQPGPSFTVSDSDVSRSPRIIVYGDQRFTDPTNTKVTSPQARRLLVGKIAKERPDAVLMSGDVPYSGDVVNDYQVFHDETKIWRDEKLHIYPSLGNHEF
ncbi:MAG: metallophosphoesterase, partial [Acidobacteria bacterium]|nr:metallophosphoesterase [Acidobacteriota bacterium]